LTELATIALAGVASGFGGWLLEWAFRGRPGYSVAFGGARVPFLPVYAVGGAMVSALAPELSGLSWPARGAAYAGALTLAELGAGLVDRATDHESWSYDGRVIDAPHALAWGALGLVAEAFLPSPTSTMRSRT
jgi:hypothetical protein